MPSNLSILYTPNTLGLRPVKVSAESRSSRSTSGMCPGCWLRHNRGFEAPGVIGLRLGGSFTLRQQDAYLSMMGWGQVVGSNLFDMAGNNQAVG